MPSARSWGGQQLRASRRRRPSDLGTTRPRHFSQQRWRRPLPWSGTRLPRALCLRTHLPRSREAWRLGCCQMRALEHGFADCRSGGHGLGNSGSTHNQQQHRPQRHSSEPHVGVENSNHANWHLVRFQSPSNVITAASTHCSSPREACDALRVRNTPRARKGTQIIGPDEAEPD